MHRYATESFPALLEFIEATNRGTEDLRTVDRVRQRAIKVIQLIVPSWKENQQVEDGD